MGKGDSGAAGGGWTGAGEVDIGQAANITLADEATMQDVANALERATDEFPELEPMLGIMEINQADLDSGVLGMYTSEGNVIVGNNVSSDMAAHVAAHEVGHGLTSRHAPQEGFRTAEQAVSTATRRYNQANPNNRLTSAGLAGTISDYARSSPREAFAEAFADWSINGNNAKEASRLIIEAWKP